MRIPFFRRNRQAPTSTLALSPPTAVLDRETRDLVQETWPHRPSPVPAADDDAAPVAVAPTAPAVVEPPAAPAESVASAAVVEADRPTFGRAPEGERTLNVRYVGRDAGVLALLREMPFVRADTVVCGPDAQCPVTTSEGQICCDLVIIDHEPGPADHLHVLKSAKAQAPSVPVIVVMPAGQADAGSAALDLGADDALQKTEVFERRLTAALRRAHTSLVERVRHADRETREERLRTLVEQAPSGVAVVAAHGDAVAMNAAASRIYGAGAGGPTALRFVAEGPLDVRVPLALEAGVSGPSADSLMLTVGRPSGEAVATTESMAADRVADELEARLADLDESLTAARARIDELEGLLGVAHARTAELEQALAHAEAALADERSRAWPEPHVVSERRDEVASAPVVVEAASDLGAGETSAVEPVARTWQEELAHCRALAEAAAKLIQDAASARHA